VAPDLDVRRLAAVDMWGSAGAPWRRWVILVEFVAGVAGIAAIGVALLVGGGALAVVLGVWAFGVAANYVPLAAHALSLIRAGRLEAELAQVDVGAELRHYTAAQLWIVVPVLVAVLGARQAWARKRRAGADG
jgi:hypothetical protein